MKTISIEQLIEVIKLSTETMKICTPSDDYYASRNDWSKDELTYINPDALVFHLEQLAMDDEHD